MTKRIGFAVLVLLAVACGTRVEETEAVTETPPAEIRIPINDTMSGPGAITGLLTYPSESMPALQVVAFQLNDELEIVDWHGVETQAGEVAYTISDLPPGTYWVVAYSFENGSAGGYTEAVRCGLTVECTDHSLVTVTVEAGKTTLGADPWDWFAPEGTFPENPLQ